MLIAETWGWTYTVTGLLATPPTLPVTVAVPEVLGGEHTVKSGMPPGLVRFQVPAHIVPVGLISASCKFELPYVAAPVLSVLPLQLVAVMVPICVD